MEFLSVLDSVAGLNVQNQLSTDNLNLPKTPVSGTPAKNNVASPER